MATYGHSGKEKPSTQWVKRKRKRLKDRGRRRSCFDDERRFHQGMFMGEERCSMMGDEDLV